MHVVQRSCADTRGSNGPWWTSNAQERGSPRITILTMVKDAIGMLREWLPYHLLLGIAHIYVINNDCATADAYNQCSLLRPYVSSGAVTVIDAPFRCRGVSRASAIALLTAQLRNQWGREVDAEHEWILQIDPDEYLVLPSHMRAPEYLRSFLATHGAIDSIPLPWRVYGTSFRSNATASGSIISNYRLRLPLALTMVGVALLMDRQKNADQVNPFLTKELLRLAALGDQKRCKDPSAAHGHLCSASFDWVTMNVSTNIEAAQKVGPIRGAVAEAFIHHYTFLSDAEWSGKKDRGRPRKHANFARRRGGVDDLFSAVYDTTIIGRVRQLSQVAARWSPEPSLARRCASSLQFSDAHFHSHHGTDPTRPPPMVAAKAALESAHMRHVAFGENRAARWFLEWWEHPGHEYSGLVKIAQSLGGASVTSTHDATHWLQDLLNDTGRQQAVTAAIQENVEGFARRCTRSEESRTGPLRVCTGWTSLMEEQV